MGWPENLDWVIAHARRASQCDGGVWRARSRIGTAAARRRASCFLSIRTGSCSAPTTGWTKPCIAIIFRWLETGDESFDYWGYPAQGRWEIYGLGLPDPVLEKIYHLNAERVFRQFKGGAGRNAMTNVSPIFGNSNSISCQMNPYGLLLVRWSLPFARGCTRPAIENGACRSAAVASQNRRKPGGPIVVTTSSAEFQILPSGYIQASLLKGDQRLTLDAPRSGSGDFLAQDGKEIQFALDFARAKIQDNPGKLGRGKRVDIPASPQDASTKIQRVLHLEVYDDFPNILLSSAEYKNNGTQDSRIDRVVEQAHRFRAKVADMKAQPYDMWSFQGASYDWGKDDVVKLTPRSRART